jgi:hypothetical protein
VTRKQLVAAWDRLYTRMVQMADRRMPGHGADIVQTTYLHMLEHKTYLDQDVTQAEAWITYRVKDKAGRMKRQERKHWHGRVEWEE